MHALHNTAGMSFIRATCNFTLQLSNCHFISLLNLISLSRIYMLIMAALSSRCGHYIFAVWFLLLSFFFPRLISAVADWMSTILLHMVWP